MSFYLIKFNNNYLIKIMIKFYYFFKDFSETVENNEVEKSKKPKEKSIKKENENINDISEVVLESRRTRSTAKSIC